MVRPRFTKLPQKQQQAILQAALDEFAAHGFHGASLNRMIEEAGISKGTMYYYFDGKEDLYAYVARTGLAGLFDRVGPLPELDRGGADEFWSVLEGYYLNLLRALAASPQLAALLRGWTAASRTRRFRRYRVTSSKPLCPGSSRPSSPDKTWGPCARICPRPC